MKKVKTVFCECGWKSLRKISEELGMVEIKEMYENGEFGTCNHCGKNLSPKKFWSNRCRKTFEERFHEFYTKKSEDECWLWIGPKVRGGYGRIALNGKALRSNRAAWIIFNKEDPGDYYVCHKCDNQACVNPNHLFLGTPKDNSRDMVEKGRSLYGEKHKRAKLTEHDVIAIRTIFEKEGKGLSELGRMYGVRHSTIDQIVNRRSWIHI